MWGVPHVAGHWSPDRWFVGSSVCQMAPGFLPSRHGVTTARILASSKRLSPSIQHTRQSALRSNIIYMHGRLPNTAQYRGPAGKLQPRGQATYSSKSGLRVFPRRKSNPGRANRKYVSLEIPRNSSFKTTTTGPVAPQRCARWLQTWSTKERF